MCVRVCLSLDSKLLFTPPHPDIGWLRCAGMRVAVVCCSVLQCVAVCCSVRVAVAFNSYDNTSRPFRRET